MKTSLLACAALAIVLSATGPASAQRSCLRVGDIWNWNAVNDRTLIVEDNLHQKFKVRLIGTCYSLRFKERLAFRSVGGMALTCLGSGDQVIARDRGGLSNRCSITKVEPYTAEMERADKDAAAAAKQQGN